MKYVCRICGYIYDEEKEQTAFKELPDDWKCPLCGAGKSDFVLVQEESEKQGAERLLCDLSLEKLSVGQLAAVCSNLARGCEKQYKEKESELFMQLSDYFASVMPPVEDASVKKLAELLESDIALYPELRAVADDHGDRGAARICVWGEKVTRMLSSLVNRYLKEGEAMLSGTDIWVCTTCGFVYIGEHAPQICPVCKVPDWKFEKIEGGH